MYIHSILDARHMSSTALSASNGFLANPTKSITSVSTAITSQNLMLPTMSLVDFVPLLCLKIAHVDTK
jgi:hypothetical protein